MVRATMIREKERVYLQKEKKKFFFTNSRSMFVHVHKHSATRASVAPTRRIDQSRIASMVEHTRLHVHIYLIRAGAAARRVNSIGTWISRAAGRAGRGRSFKVINGSFGRFHEQRGRRALCTDPCRQTCTGRRWTTTKK